MKSLTAASKLRIPHALSLIPRRAPTTIPRRIAGMAAGEPGVPPASDVPRSRRPGIHTFLVAEHGASSVKTLVAAAAGLSVLHFGVLDPNPVARAAALHTTAQFLALTWFGASAAIGWLEAPIKFQAPSLTRTTGLDVGRHVFSALNKLEIPAAALLVYAHLNGGTPGGWWPLLPAACVAVETTWLLPGLLSRAARIIAGKPVPPSRLHATSALLSVVKLGGLLALAISLQ